jgi:hypothetical protein
MSDNHVIIGAAAPGRNRDFSFKEAGVIAEHAETNKSRKVKIPDELRASTYCGRAVCVQRF